MMLNYQSKITRDPNCDFYSRRCKKQASTLALDQMVMLELENGKGRSGLTIKNIMRPDILTIYPTKASQKPIAVLISDLHVGSKYFMKGVFEFLDWLSSSPDDDIVKKIKFLCVGGDLIDGIGIFPNQDKELLEIDACKADEPCCRVVGKVP